MLPIEGYLQNRRNIISLLAFWKQIGLILSSFKPALRRLSRDKLAILGLVIIISLIIISIFAPYIAPHDPLELKLSRKLKSPTRDFPLGTDNLGRCILSRLIYGTRISLTTAVLVLILTVIVGIPLGMLSGYMGGRVDNIIMRIVDTLMAFPSLILALAIAGMLGPSLTNVMIAIAATRWVGYTRIIRGVTLSIKEKEYITAVRASGASDLRIIFYHILPNAISPIIILATLDIGRIILSITALSFLGLGAQPPTPEWGKMLNEGRPFIQVASHLMLFPGLAIMLTVAAFNFLGDGLREALDPRLRGID